MITLSLPLPSQGGILWTDQPQLQVFHQDTSSWSSHQENQHSWQELQNFLPFHHDLGHFFPCWKGMSQMGPTALTPTILALFPWVY
jgi:hypothetical protein